MPQGPAARITDNVVHPLPPILTPGPGSPTVLIGYLPAWRGVPAAAAAAMQAAKAVSDATIQAAEAATLAAAGTPGAPAAKAAEEATKAACLAQMSSTITSAAGGADIHACATPLPVPPHGPGVVIDGSPTVLINNLQACRLGDTVLEALGPPNKIVKGQMNVIIGNSGGGSSGGSSSPVSTTSSAIKEEAAKEAPKPGAPDYVPEVISVPAMNLARAAGSRTATALVQASANGDAFVPMPPTSSLAGALGGGPGNR